MCRVTVRAAGTKGRGVFAKRNFRAGEVVETAPAIFLDEADWRANEALTLGDYIFKSPTGYLLALGAGSLYNHSFAPNALWDCNDSVIQFRAAKAIRRGEEILVDYGWADEEYSRNYIPISENPLFDG